MSQGASDPLAALRPIHLPEPSGWWPPAIGWWLLLAALLLLLVAGWLGWRRWRALAPRRQALAELARLHQLSAQQPLQAVAALSTLLRRFQRLQQPVGEGAGLVDQAWLDALDRAAGWQEPHFAQGDGRLIATLPYQPALDERQRQAVDRLFPLCGRWIKRVVGGRRGV